MKKDNETLLKAALDAKKNAYAPYSNFHVGAALICDDGDIYYGCNVEYSSDGITNGAERSAIVRMVTTGERQIRSTLIVGETEDFLRT